MTDDELIEYVGLGGLDAGRRAHFIQTLPPSRRAVYEHMRNVEVALGLYSAGTGPKPAGVIICEEHSDVGRR